MFPHLLSVMTWSSPNTTLNSQWTFSERFDATIFPTASSTNHIHSHGLGSRTGRHDSPIPSIAFTFIFGSNSIWVRHLFVALSNSHHLPILDPILKASSAILKPSLLGLEPFPTTHLWPVYHQLSQLCISLLVAPAYFFLGKDL